MHNPVEAAAGKHPELFGRKPRGMSRREWNRLRIKAIQAEESNVYTTTVIPFVHVSRSLGTARNAEKIDMTQRDYNG